jgi:hypothetical protein
VQLAINAIVLKLARLQHFYSTNKYLVIEVSPTITIFVGQSFE